jgi:hypothetical protein
MSYFRVFESSDTPGDWKVQAFDAEGQIFACIFTGSGARERAEEYSSWKNETVVHLQAA